MPRTLLRFSAALFGLISLYGLHAQPAQVDVTHYDLHLELDLPRRQLQGEAQIHFTVLEQPLRVLRLSLHQLKVQQARLAGHPDKLVYEQVGDELLIELPQPMSRGSKQQLSLAYQGTPDAPSLFGGVYMADSSAYNLGVWIEGNPPSFGRAWYPCIDNFTDKATYTTQITVPSRLMAVSAGEYQGAAPSRKGTTTHRWELQQPIPTYLMSFAVGRYIAVRDTVQGQERPIPIVLWVPPHRVASARASFRQLKACFRAFEGWFGAYAWPHIGYVAVPMQGGAMEHATNIAYPLQHIDGSELQNTLWAHELAHSWFGNLVTAVSPSEMWLNEGFARYCETLFIEATQGPAAARHYQAQTHYAALTRCPLADGGHYAVAHAQPEHTYGCTVYDKGATVVHAMRHQLADSLFFGGLRHHLAAYAWRNADTDGLRHSLEQYSGQDLAAFFAGWAEQGGFPHFRLADTVRLHPDSLRVTLVQQLYHRQAPVARAYVPLWAVHPHLPTRRYRVAIQGERDTATLAVPTGYQLWLDPENSLSDARLCRLDTLTAEQPAHAYAELELDLAGTGTAFSCLHLGLPDKGPGPAYPRWWEVQGWTQGELQFRFHYAAARKPAIEADSPEQPYLPYLYYQASPLAGWQQLAALPLSGRHEIPHTGRPGRYAIFYLPEPATD